MVLMQMLQEQFATGTILLEGYLLHGTHFGFGHTRPRITDQPDDQTVCVDAKQVFSIAATGYGTL